MKIATLVLSFLALTCALAGAPLPADIPAGVLKGAVEDPNKGAIAGASLTLANPSGKVAEATTDMTGQFSIAGLASGDYVLTAQAEGFKQAEIPVQVAADTPRSLQIKLKVAAVVQELTVSASIDPVAADGSTDAVQVDADLLKSLPVIEGNPLSTAALFLDPATVGSQGATVVVDGVESSGLDVPESSVKKVFVNKNPYSAEFSRPGKGRIEVMTRPGSTSHIRHRVILTLRDSSLDAKNAFAKTKPPMRRGLFEGEMDGKLGSKANFYVGTDHLIDDRSAIVSALTPSGAVSENVPSPETAWRSVGRIDFHLTPLHNLSLRYNGNRSSRDNQGIGAFDLRERGYNQSESADEFRVNESATLSPHFFNEVRFSHKNRSHDLRSLSDAPALLVPGAFQAGGAQMTHRNREAVVHLENVANYVQGQHIFTFGGGVRRRSLDVSDASNFGGTYTFASLADFIANRPLLFTVNQGNPAVRFSQSDVMSFVQDEMRLRKDLGLLVGVRHAFQSDSPDHVGFAPRMSLSYAPGESRTVFRFGAGAFYDRQPTLMRQNSLLFDGAHLRQSVVANPVFGDPAAASLLAPSVTRIASGRRLPYILQATAGVEQKFGKSSSVSVEYRALRGEHLYRLRNINAPLPGTGDRPNADFLNINQFESTGHSRGKALTVTVRTAYRTRFELLSQYTLSRTMDDTPGMFGLPADNYDLRGEFGRADYDRRHRVTSAAILRLAGGWKLGTILTLSSGAPFNITTGRDDNHDTAVNDRPAGVGRNTGHGPATANTDFRLSKRFFLEPEKGSRSRYIEARFDAFNVFNHVNAVTYVGVLSSPLFGQANAALPGRQMQASVKVNF